MDITFQPLVSWPLVSLAALAVVVIGGFVGAGALGYLVILGATKPEMQGKGLTAGLAILLLGVAIDRTAQYAVRRNATQHS